MNAVYARMFGAHRPARTTVQVAGFRAKGCASRSMRSRTCPDWMVRSLGNAS